VVINHQSRHITTDSSFSINLFQEMEIESAINRIDPVENQIWQANVLAGNRSFFGIFGSKASESSLLPTSDK
jgi:hypothetical protein